MSAYDPRIWDAKTPANVIGGRNRASVASRDIQGRFLPKDEFSLSMWELDAHHRRAGGLKVLEKYGRGYFVSLASKRRKS